MSAKYLPSIYLWKLLINLPTYHLKISYAFWWYYRWNSNFRCIYKTISTPNVCFIMLLIREKALISKITIALYVVSKLCQTMHLCYLRNASRRWIFRSGYLEYPPQIWNWVAYDMSVISIYFSVDIHITLRPTAFGTICDIYLK